MSVNDEPVDESIPAWKRKIQQDKLNKKVPVNFKNKQKPFFILLRDSRASFNLGSSFKISNSTKFKRKNQLFFFFFFSNFLGYKKTITIYKNLLLVFLKHLSLFFSFSNHYSIFSSTWLDFLSLLKFFLFFIFFFQIPLQIFFLLLIFVHPIGLQ